MRKYYQLLLVILSIISFTVLLMYKSENNRLKYVLQVVNFFGRKDSASLLHLDEDEIYNNIYEPALPLPVWSSIGNDFHIYATYYQLSDDSTGLHRRAEAFGMVVGPQKTDIDYKCYLKYNDERIIEGKFKFKAIDRKHLLKDFKTYLFLCTIMTRELEMPESVIFVEKESKGTEHEIRLRHIRPKLRSKENLTAKRSNILTICLNMFKEGGIFPSGFINQNNLLQFFISHKLIGVNQFSVYHGDAIGPKLRLILYNLGLNIHYYPFNFPYSLRNTSANHQIRQIIENDCIIRNWNSFEYSSLLNPNEFVYMKNILDNNYIIVNNSFNTSPSSSSLSDQVLRFEIPSFAVCLDKKKFLVDNNLYDPEFRFGYNLFIYRTQGYILPLITATNVDTIIPNRSISLTSTDAISHRYIDCISVGHNGLYNWRTKLKEDFMKRLKTLRVEINSKMLL